MTTQKEDLILSIITPYCNSLQYTKKLLEVLSPQLNNQTEWIIIDDGCHEEYLDKYASDNIRIIHTEINSGGASTPRNIGLEKSNGKYIVFIDGDDLVKENYIDLILNKINKEDFDLCYFGWKSNVFEIIIKDKPPEWNHAVWNCIYRRSLIGNNRFDPNLIIAEDYDFNQKVKHPDDKISHIEEVLYLYQDNPSSLSHQI